MLNQVSGIAEFLVSLSQVFTLEQEGTSVLGLIVLSVAWDSGHGR